MSLSKGKTNKAVPFRQNNNNHSRLKRLFKHITGTFNRVIDYEKWEIPTVQKLVVALVTSIFVALILSPDIQFFTQKYSVGDIAIRDIKSSIDLLVEDKLSTEKKREEARQELKSIYDLDRMVLPKLRARLEEAFNAMQGFYVKRGGVEKIKEMRKEVLKRKVGRKSKVDSSHSSEVPPVDPAEVIDDLEIKKKKFYEDIGIELTEREFSRLEESDFDLTIVDTIMEWLAPMFGAGLVADKELLLLEKDKGILIRDLQTKEERLEPNLNKLYDLNEAKRQIEVASQKTQGVDKALKRIAVKVAQKNLMPNLTFNKSATEERNKEILASVKPVYFQIKKGEVIVREGERVSEDDFIKIQGLLEETKKQKVPLFAIGVLLLTFILFLSSYQFSKDNIRKFRSYPKDILLMGLILIGTLLIIEFSLFVAEAFEENYPLIPSMAYTYAIPVVAGAMLIRLFLNSETSLIFAAIMSFLSAMILDKDIFFAIYFFLGSLVGAGGLKHCTQRVTIIKAGFLVGLANVLIILTLGIVNSAYGFKEYLLYIPFGFMGGLIASIVATGVTPIVEHGLGYTTNIKLLELARMDHPLLKELALQAPGTYHHSIIIGSLVEAAAEVIQANPLLARVSAFYHDIGKMKKPHYFVENQREENRHERLAPSMSALVLISHVKEGVEMAKLYRLGKEIIDIIKEHHGTSLITYFYQKAKDGEDPDVHEINEKDFRYPGPKPQTKEAGLVMLADAVEAACKTIPDPTPAKIQGAVHKIINKIFADGQLDECELTLRDLNEIARVFNRVLNGIYHCRIDYPEPAYIMKSHLSKDYDKEKIYYEDFTSEQAEGGKDRHKEIKKVSKPGLKRLGVSKK